METVIEKMETNESNLRAKEKDSLPTEDDNSWSGKFTMQPKGLMPSLSITDLQHQLEKATAEDFLVFPGTLKEKQDSQAKGKGKAVNVSDTRNPMFHDTTNRKRQTFE